MKEVMYLADMKNAKVFREVIKTCVRKLGFLQKADAACCGVTIAQCHTIVEIGKGSLSLNELADSLTLDKSTMSRTVDNLVQAGLVEREIDKADRRYSRISLTTKGQEMVAVINKNMEKYYQRVLSVIPSEKHAIVTESLPYLLAAIKETELHFDKNIKRNGGDNCE